MNELEAAELFRSYPCGDFSKPLKHSFMNDAVKQRRYHFWGVPPRHLSSEGDTPWCVQ
jgi:hypothetical protein